MIFFAAGQPDSQAADQDCLELLVEGRHSQWRESHIAFSSEPVFLATRTAGKLLQVNHVTAWRWLFLLTHDGVVEEVEKGDRAKRQASRFRYRGD